MNPPTSPIRLGSPGEDISKKDLQLIVQRFLRLNHTRLQRIQSFLLPRQRIFLDLLPLLFHQNHPLLPGFISLEGVAGIPDYKPSHKTIAQARLFSKNFTYKRSIQKDYPIQGIYLMGSVSSLAFAKLSDIDIWLCHTSNLSATQIDELQCKATAIEKWAETLDVEVHFFLIDSEQYAQGNSAPLSAESCGKTQRYLLLEEFYRTALYIAGRTPVWWLVPPHEEQNYNSYVQHLKQKRFIAAHETIDFGSIEDIPAEEFVTATLWHLYKSLNSPYKSLLKLLLMECYASEYPNPQWLSVEAKRAVYEGRFDLNDLDPYVLIYHKIEQYLSRKNDPERLNFARQCFYLKIMGDMEPQFPQKLALRETLIKQMEKQYQWPENMVSDIEKNKTWDIKKANQENDIIIRQLKLCYQMICQFSELNAYSIQNQDIQPIGRKLKSFLQKRPGKIDIITTRANIHNRENELSIIEAPASSSRQSWDLYLGAVPKQKPATFSPFKHGARSLVELLSWLVSNGLYQQKLNLHIHTNEHPVSKANVNHTLTLLKDFFLRHSLGNQAKFHVFRQPSRVIDHVLLVNLSDTPPEDAVNGTLVISERSDILSYGPEKKSFISTIDQVSINSWGEVNCNRFLGLEGLFNCLLTSFNQFYQPVPAKIECYTSIRGKSIALGVNVLFKNLHHLFNDSNKLSSPRLIVCGGSAYYIFQRIESVLQYSKAANLDALSQELSAAQLSFNTVDFNGPTLSNTPLPFLYSYAKAGTIQIFCYARDAHINLYIIDEKGSLYTRSHYNASPRQLLTAYSNFLQTLYDKGVLSSTLKIECYDLFYTVKDKYTVKKSTLPPAQSWDYLSVRLTGEVYGSPPEILYSLYCNELEFSPDDIEEDIFSVVARYIYMLRKSKEKYPIHISDIDVPLQALGVSNQQQLQSIHYLHYKQEIESRLNAV